LVFSDTYELFNMLLSPMGSLVCALGTFELFFSLLLSLMGSSVFSCSLYATVFYSHLLALFSLLLITYGLLSLLNSFKFVFVIFRSAISFCHLWTFYSALIPYGLCFLLFLLIGSSICFSPFWAFFQSALVTYW
jgi:hypothetical protein